MIRLGTETFFYGGSASPCRKRQKLNPGVVSRLDFCRLPGPVFDTPRLETAGRVIR